MLAGLLLWLGDALCPLADSATSKLPAAATATAAAAYSDTTAATAAAAYNDTTAAATAATHGAASHGAATRGAATRGAGTLGSDLITKLRLGAFLVEDIEGRQAHVRKLFLAENDFVVRRGLLRGQVRHWRGARCGEGATR